MIVGTVETMARMRYGPDGGLNPIERVTIEPNLAAMLAKLPAHRAEAVQSILPPLILLYGVVQYGNRIANLEMQRGRARQKQAQDQAVKAAETIVNQNVVHSAPPNGRVEFPTVPDDISRAYGETADAP